MDKLINASMLVDDLERASLQLIDSNQVDEESSSEYGRLREAAAGDKQLLGRLPDFVLQNTSGARLKDYFKSLELEPDALVELITREFAIAGDRITIHFQPDEDKLNDEILRLGDQELLELLDLAKAKLRGGHYSSAIRESQRLLKSVLTNQLGSGWSDAAHPFAAVMDQSGQIQDHDPLSFRRISRSTSGLVQAILAISPSMTQPMKGTTSQYQPSRQQAEFVVNVTFAVIQLFLQSTSGDIRPIA